MSPSPDVGERPRRILVIANETCAGRAVVDEVRYRAGGEAAEVLVVAPALARSRLEHWLTSDLDRRQAEAAGRLEASVAAFRRAGLGAEGRLGDADPLQALDDGMRTFAPDQVVISTHPHHRSNWLERQVVRKARERYPVPVTHVIVDLEHESATAEADSRARHGAGGEGRMRVFHASDYDEALAIKESGFRDVPGPGERSGVWVTERPPPEASAERVVFAVDVPADAVSAFEEEAGDEEGRRFLVPAELLNRHGPPVADGQWSE